MMMNYVIFIKMMITTFCAGLLKNLTIKLTLGFEPIQCLVDISGIYQEQEVK